MKLLSLSLENLASISSSVTIDFQSEPLGTAGIFAITGKTGSGKSTLLDAICLALYATTPRYEKYPLKKGVEQMLHKGASKGYARVLFQSIQGELYEAEWRIARKRTRKDATEEPDVKIERSLRRIEDNTVISTSVSEIKVLLPQLLGLTYEQFTRSVMLAQGDFTAFLKADSGAKASLLEKLTGTDLYSRISIEVHERSTFETVQLKSLLVQKGNIEILGAAARDALAEQVEKLESEEHRLRQEEKETERQRSHYVAYQQLETSVAEAQEKHTIARSEEESSQLRAQQLKLAEAATQMREPMRLAAELAEILEGAQLHLEHLEKEEAELSQHQEEVSRTVQESRTVVAVVAAAEVKLQPQIAEARRQDSGLAILEERKKAIGETNRKAAAVAQQLATGLQNRKAAITAQQAEETILANWLTRKVPYRELFQNKAVVQQLLHEKNIQEKEILAVAEAAGKANTAVTENGARVAQGTVSLTEITEAFSQSLEQIRALGLSVSREEILAGINTAPLEANQNFWKVQSQLWQLSELGQQHLALEEKKLSAQENSLVLLRSNLQNQTAEKEKAVVQQMEKRQRHAALKLAHSTTVAELRRSLSAGEPCPVCGSEAHPAAQTALPAIDHLLEAYEAEAQKATQYFEQVLREEATAQSELKSAEKSVAQLHVEIERAEKIQVQQLLDWEHSATAEERHLPAAARTAFYESAQLRLALQCKAYAHVQQCANDWKLATAAQDLLAEKLHSAISRKQEVQQDWDRIKAALEENTKNLKRFFTTPDWETKLKADPSAFAAGVEKMSNEWQQKEEAFSRLQTARSNSQEILETDAQRHKMAAQDFEESQLLFEAAQSKLAAAQVCRQELLSGQPADAVAAQLNEKRNAAAIQLGIAEKTADRLTIELRELLRDRQSTRRQQMEIQQKEATAIIQINDWLVEHRTQSNTPLMREDLHELLRYLPAEMAAERIALAAIKEAVQRSKVLLEERGERLKIARQKLSATPEADLDSALALLQEQLEYTGIQKAHSVLRLAQDNNGRTQLGDLLHRIETQERIAGRWQKLKELIGSSDGKAFRSIAQEYTLDILLVEANLQLAQLAPRYRLLRATGTLDLQIADRDMGNEVRTVHSISGGESFLVSLSLALGLAALSAGRQLVECLFIDEGFGMLDPATLHMALNALETLQQQGRKIGVISHIKENDGSHTRANTGTQEEQWPECSGSGSGSGVAFQLCFWFLLETGLVQTKKPDSYLKWAGFRSLSKNRMLPFFMPAPILSLNL